MTVPNLEPGGRRHALLRLLSDESLARRAESGSRRAFDAICSRYRQDLYRFCLAMTGNPEDAELALKGTMAKALQGLKGGDRQIKLKPWLYRIARNETVDAPPQHHQAGTPGPEQHRLLTDLEQLPQRQRAVLVMRELSELDFIQIGAAFGISATVAMEDVYEARLKLRQLQDGREQHCARVMWELSEVEGRAGEPYEAVAGETTHPDPPSSAEASADSAGESPSDGHEPPETPPAPPIEVETPAAAPPPPAFDGGQSRRSGEWSRSRRPRHRR